MSLLFLRIGSECCSVCVIVLSLGDCFLVVKSTKLIPDHPSAGKMIGALIADMLITRLWIAYSHWIMIFLGGGREYRSE